MNETTMEPEGLDDPALLAEIEAEFAELTAEIQRISAMPSHVGPRKSELLEALRASWRERLEAKTGDRPQWRQKLDETISRAVDRLLEDGIVENADGSIGFALRGDTLQNEGGPLLRGLLDGLSNMLTEKLPSAAPATPANPLQGLLGNLGQVLAGALKSAVSQVGGQVEAKVPTEGGDLNIVVKPAKAAEGDVELGKSVDVGAVDFQGEQKLAASFEIDTRKQPEGQGAAGTQVFFQQLFAGLGQAVRQAIAPTPPASNEAPDANKTPESAKAASPFSGLGQLFADAIQRAFTPPASPSAQPEAPVTAAAPSEPATEAASASQDAGGTPADREGDSVSPAETAPEGEALRVRIPQVDTEGAPTPEGQPAPALNVDLAGLLRQVLGNLKPPS